MRSLGRCPQKKEIDKRAVWFREKFITALFTASFFVLGVEGTRLFVYNNFIGNITGKKFRIKLQEGNTNGTVFDLEGFGNRRNS